MKKFLFFFVLVLACTIVLPAFGQKMANSEIQEMILKSKEFNQQTAGVFDPNLIFPGQTLTYFFRDGAVEMITVEPGDNQWVIVRDKLSKLREKHGGLVEPNSGESESEPQPEKSIFASSELPPWWALCILGAVVLLIILAMLAMTNWKKLRGKPKGKFSGSPATEGDPFVPGGIAGNAENHFRNLFPGAIFKDMQRKFVSTPGGVTADVEFADGTHAKLSFRNEPGWVAMVSTNGGKKFNQEIVFEACGNPINRRKSLKNKNLILSDIPTRFGDEPIVTMAPVSETIDQKPEAQAPENFSPQDLKKPEETKLSELYQMGMVVKDVLGELAKSQKVHKLDFLWNDSFGGGNVTLSVTTKNELTEAGKGTEREKKES